MSSMRFTGVVAAVAIPLALGACDTIKGTYNLVTGQSGNAASDQSLSAGDDNLRRPPLTLPPDFNLRPPATASAVGATDITAAQQARQTVFGLDQEKGGQAGAQRSTGVSSGEAALLQHAGATASGADIRKKVDRETNALEHQENSFVNNLLNPPGDANAGKSSDEGWFSGLFGDANKPSIER
ncbi:MAG TPA: DUF3035 domain-containing protein [Alphaproteobacteria bacterium]|nr:DUF3035 domain-containing protein [Alphaproteobacteria bacterium]